MSFISKTMSVIYTISMLIKYVIDNNNNNSNNEGHRNIIKCHRNILNNNFIAIKHRVEAKKKVYSKNIRKRTVKVKKKNKKEGYIMKAYIEKPYNHIYIYLEIFAIS
jgi:hypothetical protein